MGFQNRRGGAVFRIGARGVREVGRNFVLEPAHVRSSSKTEDTQALGIGMRQLPATRRARSAGQFTTRLVSLSTIDGTRKTAKCCPSGNTSYVPARGPSNS